MKAGTLEEVQGVVSGGGDADDILRRVVSILHEQLDRFVRVSFVEADALLPGPAQGDETDTTAFPISFQGRHVADLEAGGELSPSDHKLLEQVAAILSPYALVGWDTGGEEWTP